MLHRIDKNTELDKSSLSIAAGVRDDLDKTYKFHDSNAGVYMFNPWKYDENLFNMFKELRVSEEIIGRVEKCRDNTSNSYNIDSYIGNGICHDTEGSGGYDYIIFIATAKKTSEFVISIFSEEIMHGEHIKMNKKPDNAYRICDPSMHRTWYPFSVTAGEFIGGLGSFHYASKSKDQAIDFQPRLGYDSELGKFYIDYHDIPYELAKQAIKGEDEWKSAMFHAPNEKELWQIYNEVLFPNIEIMVPAVFDNKSGLKKEIDEHAKSIGLRCNIDFTVDKSDTRGLKLG